MMSNKISLLFRSEFNRRAILLALVTIVSIIVSCTLKKTSVESKKPSDFGLGLVNPVLPGDNPDPSIIRVGKTYYATSTTNEWAPSFTIYKSTDLKNWKLINHVFPDGFKDMKNEWGENNYWASELAYDETQNRIYAYYTAHNRNVSGNPGLQCGVAYIDVDKIETGKFIDNGPVIIEEGCGAIDAFEMKDNGKIYVFWKNDGNGCGQETWLWMQEINESRTKLIGEKKKLFTNSQPWETALVEGACFFKKGDYYYCLYAVGGCCDARCDYKTGIARTKSLESGVWEKYENNPIMQSNENWLCPGHGTVVEDPKGRLFMLYHAFDKKYGVYVGREGILEELQMTKDGWPLAHNATIANRPKELLNFSDDFTKSNSLNIAWQWPSKLEKPVLKFNKGLNLSASNQNHELGTFLGQYIKTINFTATAKILVNDVDAGVCLGGAIFESKWPGELGGIGISASKTGFKVFSNYEGKYQVIKQSDEAVSGEVLVRIQIRDDFKNIDFMYKAGKGAWSKFHTASFDAAKYVPWGMGYRIGLVAKGSSSQSAVFENFKLENQ